MKKRTRLCRRRGVAMVEFALVLPILITVVMGIIMFGRAMTVQTMLTNAARGARNAILAALQYAGVQTAVDTYLNNSGLTSGYTTTITPTSTNAASGTVIHVTVTYPFVLFKTYTWLNWVDLGTINLNSSVYMRRE